MPLPRERLFNAIENDCSYGHIDYLVNELSIDVTGFLDLIVSKAIDYGSYETLLWLQEKASVKLDTIKDANDNGYLHQIVQGKRAFKFFASYEIALWEDRDPCIVTESYCLFDEKRDFF